MGESKTKQNRDIVRNRRATFDYEIEDRFEAGIALVGSEVKSLRYGHCEVGDAYISVDHGEAWLKQMQIPAYEKATAYPHDPKRARRLLLHRREIRELESGLARQGLTAIVLRLYFAEGRVKAEIALCRGKKNYDKRKSLAEKTEQREALAEMKRGKKWA